MIYVGTCGFAYKDWIGPFYPAKIKSSEMLPFYARRFRAVEIDSSYYGVPAAATIEALRARTPADFRYSFKAPQTVTHAPDIRARVHDDALLLRERLEPMRNSGKLAAVLLQFPNGFRPGQASEAYLSAVVAAFEGLPLVAEFRHREWQQPETFVLLRELGVGWSNVDLPHLETLPLPSADATASVAYVRLHGRNAKQWWTGNNVTRYAYNYTAEELAGWTDRVADLDEQARETYVFFNNHSNGRAAENAEMMEALLEDRYGEAGADAIARPSIEPAPSQYTLPGFE